VRRRGERASGGGRSRHCTAQAGSSKVSHRPRRRAHECGANKRQTPHKNSLTGDERYSIIGMCIIFVQLVAYGPVSSDFLVSNRNLVQDVEPFFDRDDLAADALRRQPMGLILSAEGSETPVEKSYSYDQSKKASFVFGLATARPRMLSSSRTSSRAGSQCGKRSRAT